MPENNKQDNSLIKSTDDTNNEDEQLKLDNNKTNLIKKIDNVLKKVITKKEESVHQKNKEIPKDNKPNTDKEYLQSLNMFIMHKKQLVISCICVVLLII